MTGLVDVIVGLWFLPVTLCIILPLTMLGCWSLGRLFATRKSCRNAVEEKLEGKVVANEKLVRARS